MPPSAASLAVSDGLGWLGTWVPDCLRWTGLPLGRLGPLVSASGYTSCIATQRKQRNDRVQFPRDPALDRAIKRGRAAMGPSTPTSKVVRELALRGAEAFEGDEAAERKAVDFALSVADGTSGLDLDRLRSARERAWDR
jgi:hypothetical protein